MTTQGFTSKLKFWEKSSEPKKAKVNNGSGKAKKFLSKLSGAFMLPVSIMAIAGLFLGVGAALSDHIDNEGMKIFGSFIKNLGDPIFGAMPALFMVALVIAFTDDIGSAVFSGLIAFLVFSAIQTPFITTHSYADDAGVLNGLWTDYMSASGGDGGFSYLQDWQLAHKGLQDALDAAVISGDNNAITLATTALDTFMKSSNWDEYEIWVNKANELSWLFTGNNGSIAQGPHKIFGSSSIGHSTFLFINTSSEIQQNTYSVVGSNLGIKSLNTSIFGGIAVGLIVSYLYNRFHTIQLPTMISFFGGKRFVPIVSIGAMIPLAFFFLLIWPWIGLGFAYFGIYSGKVAGLDSFLFGFVERSLIPFGLHHVFYAPLWWTAAGGDINQAMNDWHGTILSINGNGVLPSTSIIGEIKFVDPSIKPLDGIDPNKAQGDSYGWLAAQSSGINTITYIPEGATVAKTEKLFPFIDNELGINLGRFMQGKFAFMQLGLPAAGAAMVMAAPKENRKLAAGVIFPACLTSFVTGVTEPIEFTFIFLAPALFWGFHAVMAGFSFLFMNLLGAHVGMTFSGGIIDTIIYGALPIAQGTHFYWMYVIGAAYAPIYYFVFYWAIKKFDLATPGRGGNVKLFTKADVKAAHEGAAHAGKGGLSPQGAAIVKAYGGWDNITNFTNCATRLRYDVKDINKVDMEALKAAGAMGTSKIGDSHVQTILGPVAEQINVNIKSHIGAPLGEAVAVEKPKAEDEKVVTKSHVVKAVIAGTVKSVKELEDGVFSELMLGDGVVISSPKTLKLGSYLAPISGELVSVMPHAYGIKTEDGVEILLHIGLDTVKLDGRGFDSKVKQGDKVKVGELLVEVDLEQVRPQVPSVDAIVVVTSMQELKNKAEGKVTKTSTLFEIN